MTGRFDPRPNEPYGVCGTCAKPMNDEASARAHMSETFNFAAASSHRISVTNPTRPQLIGSEVG